MDNERLSRTPVRGTPVRLGDFLFDRATGELERTDGENKGGKQRLSPQPSQLLGLLIEHAGDLVPHQAIRDRLWGDVEVEFEQGLHFCVRQVRAALGDSATAPRYIETLPRRGYRLLMPVSSDGSAPDRSAAVSLATPPALGDAAPDGGVAVTPARPQKWLALGILALFAMVIMGLTSVWLVGRATSGPVPEGPMVASTKPVALAVMTFRPSEDVGLEDDPIAIAEHILLRLGQVDVGQLGVVGPTTTEAYGSDLGSVRRLTEASEVDYVLNGRWLARAGQSTLLVELIRARDGAHLWVERFEPANDYEAIADQAAAATLEILGLAGIGFSG